MSLMERSGIYLTRKNVLIYSYDLKFVKKNYFAFINLQLGR